MPSNQALEYLTRKFGPPKVDMFALDSYRLWWQSVHLDRGGSASDLAGQGRTIEEAAENAVMQIGYALLDDRRAYVGPRDKCPLCKEHVDF